MAANYEKTSKIPMIDDTTEETGPREAKIDRTAPAGREDSLGAQSVPHLIVNRDNAACFDPGSPQVKVMTVNAAKGHEFDVVVLFGLDTLAEPPAPGQDPDPRHGRWGNAGLVGMTRARDLLLVTWTKHNNPHIKRLRHLAGAGTRSITSHTWPEDYR